ncbi:MAG: hypothetical protein L6246_03410 [Thermodesulfovibrionales bacterium]|nr:hypothetical protein [Thermodesulfovibrionales bacterium]
MRILVLGMGNLLRSDDGVGLHVIAVQEKLPLILKRHAIKEINMRAITINSFLNKPNL